MKQMNKINRQVNYNSILKKTFASKVCKVDNPYTQQVKKTIINTKF